MSAPGRLRRTPLPSQAAARIRRAIDEGRWRVGDRLPGESELALELGISRASLREAVRMLVSEGLLDRRHGIGTFVLRVPPPSIERGIDELVSLGEAIEQLGYTPSVGEHSVDLVVGPSDAHSELRLRPGVRVVHLMRVRLADGRPVIVCDDYFSEDLLRSSSLTPQEAAEEVIEGGSLYRWFDERLGLDIDVALTRIEPITASKAEARSFRVPSGAALIRLRQIHYTADGMPILYSENVHNSDVIHFHVQRRRLRRLAVPMSES